MGLDIILDMSHCTCKNHAEHANISSKPSSVGPRAAPRCQPRPVLLEINQSCSMNSDSTLDRVIKGEALVDGFTLAAPDEQWLLERYIDSLIMSSEKECGHASPGRPSVAVSEVSAALASASDAPLASAIAASVEAKLSSLSGARVTGVAQRASLVGLAEAGINEAHHRAAARTEASALIRAVAADPFMPGLVAAVSGPASADSEQRGSGSTVRTAANDHKPAPPPPLPLAAASSLSLTPPAVRPCTLGVVPWAPIPAGFSLRTAIPSAWQEEAWFGPAAATPAAITPAAVAAPMLASPKPAFAADGSVAQRVYRATSPRPAAAAAAPLKSSSAAPAALVAAASTSSSGFHDTGLATSHVSSLGQFQPLSQRAELVLALRRIYEHLHIGGYQQLLPPPTPELARRFRRIAEHVPSSLRETISFTRRRQDALAFRAGAEFKKKGFK
jgi:hypothetical protein